MYDSNISLHVCTIFAYLMRRFIITKDTNIMLYGQDKHFIISYILLNIKIKIKRSVSMVIIIQSDLVNFVKLTRPKNNFELSKKCKCFKKINYKCIHFIKIKIKIFII